MEKLICVRGGDTTELDNYLKEGWSIKMMTCTSTSCTSNGQASFYSFCFVAIKKEG